VPIVTGSKFEIRILSRALPDVQQGADARLLKPSMKS